MLLRCQCKMRIMTPLAPHGRRHSTPAIVREFNRGNHESYEPATEGEPGLRGCQQCWRYYEEQLFKDM